jgi:hypothetical protein
MRSVDDAGTPDPSMENHGRPSGQQTGNKRHISKTFSYLEATWGREFITCKGARVYTRWEKHTKIFRNPEGNRPLAVFRRGRGDNIKIDVKTRSSEKN